MVLHGSQRLLLSSVACMAIEAAASASSILEPNESNKQSESSTECTCVHRYNIIYLHNYGD